MNLVFVVVAVFFPFYYTFYIPSQLLMIIDQDLTTNGDSGYRLAEPGKAQVHVYQSVA